ncbi:ArnT family glycosyltransferase [Alteraurantiacibacter aquimixticola]|uniref:ArnT family glycosyltransferase n=1 Tax=Alteraurantiacibacter aquimixticola TaxID=2489173 RepID=UPI00145B9FD4|nr:glycosyltransferase family 39 protein [Alteraurantiacibacter aquimixticola]
MQEIHPRTFQQQGEPAKADLRSWHAGAIILLFLVLVRSTWFGDNSATYDEQLYSFIGWRMGYGELPYIDWWDRKPFGLFAIYGLAHALFGPEVIAFQLVAAASAGAAAWLTYLLARELADRLTSAIAACLVIIILAYYGCWSGQTEVFLAPLMLAMVWLLRDPEHPQALRRSLVAMLIGGIALQVKYTVLPQCLFLGCYALWGQFRQDTSLPKLATLASAFAALGLLPTALVAGFYAAVGGWDAFVFANFISFFDRIPAPRGRLNTALSWFHLPLMVLLAAGVLALFRRLPEQYRAQRWFIIGWTVSAFATVLFPATVYPYYYASVVAPLALFALPAYLRSGPAGAVPAIVLLAGALYMINLPGNRAYVAYQNAEVERLAEAVRPHVGASENCLLVYDGPTVLYRLTGSCAPSRLVYPDHLNNQLESNALGMSQAGEVARILATRPGAIITSESALTPQNPDSQRLIEQALAAYYVEVERADLRGRETVAWVRR